MAVRNGWTFAQVPIDLTCNRQVSDGAFRVFAYLRFRQGTKDQCWPSLARIASDLGISEDTARRRVRELEAAGYLEVAERPGRSHVYRVIDQPSEALGGSTDATGSTDTTGSRAATPPLAQVQPHPLQSCNPTPCNPARENDIQVTRDNERETRNDIQPGPSRIWEQVLAELSHQLTRATFETWVKGTQVLAVEGDTWVIGCANEYGRDWCDGRLRGTLERTLLGCVEERRHLKFVVVSQYEALATQSRPVLDGEDNREEEGKQ